MAIDSSELIRAFGKIHDAALDPSLWNAMLQNISDVYGCIGVNIMAPAGGLALDGVLYTDSLGRPMEEYVKEEWHLRDYRAQFMPMIIKNGIVLESDLVTPEARGSLEYYRFIAQFNLGYLAIANFSAGDEQFFFCLQRHLDDGPFDSTDGGYLMHLRNHLQSAATTMQLLQRSHVEGQLAAFEMAKLACVFFDKRGMVTAANNRANAILSGDVRIVQGKIRAVNYEESSHFESLLTRALNSDGSLSAPGIAVLSRRDKRPLLARIEPVRGKLRDVFTEASAMVFFEDIEEARPKSADVLSKLFRLTQMECRVALLIADGLDTFEIADRCGISRETTRSHVRAIFHKTDTSRQAQLAALIGRLSSP